MDEHGYCSGVATAGPSRVGAAEGPTRLAEGLTHASTQTRRRFAAGGAAPDGPAAATSDGPAVATLDGLISATPTPDGPAVATPDGLAVKRLRV